MARLEKAGAWAVKCHGERYGRVGVPDVLALHRGVMLAIEVKRPGHRPTPAQLRELTAIRRAGGRVAVITDASQVDVILASVEEIAA